MKYLQFFESFKERTGEDFVKKLKIYAEASPVVTTVSDVDVADDEYTFEIKTTLPGYMSNKGKTSYKVFVPRFVNNKVPYVLTFEDNRQVLKTSLEVSGENKMNLLLLNYIEATQLFDDNVIEQIVDMHDQVKSPEDVKKIIRNMGEESDTAI